MNTDCTFRIGSTHKVCQDYAMTKDNAVVISDGCSGSRLSDIGSRLLCINLLEQEKKISQHNKFLIEAQYILPVRPILKMLDLPNESLDATLGYIVVKKEFALAKLYGDGVIIVGLKNGDAFVISCEYTDGYPFYINYLFDGSRRYSNWIEKNNQRKLITKKLYGKEIADDLIIINDDEKIENGKAIAKSCAIIWDEHSVGVHFHNFNAVEYVIITSDGIDSFYKTIETETSLTNEPISYMDVLKELLPFKNLKGNFIQRRVNKFLKQCEKNNWHHSDDISFGAVSFGE